MNCANCGFVANMWDNVGMLMSGFFFSGSVAAKIDEKGRFVLPQDMRYGLVEDGKCEFVIGLGLGGCLAIYRKSVIAKIVEKFQKMQHVAQYQKFFTLFFSTLHPTECDKVGRVAIPATLRSAIGLGKDLVVAGVMDKIELWPKEVYDRNLRQLVEGKELNGAIESAFALLNDVELPQPSSPAAAPAANANPLYFESIPAKV